MRGIQQASGWSRPGRLDIVLASSLLLVGQFEVWADVRIGGIGSTGPHRGVEALAALLATVPLLWRRSAPLLAAFPVAVSAAGAALLVGQVSLLAGLLPLLLVVYAGSAHLAWPRSALVVALALGAQTAFVAGIDEEHAPGEILFGLFVILGTAVLGDLGRRRSSRAETATAELRRLEQRREIETELALADERAAIARELHDVIAHGVSVMGVQAAAARVLVESDPPGAKAALRGIEAQAFESVGELQRLLGVLRDVESTTGREPQPGLGQIDTLLDQIRRAGVPVELRVEGDRRELPPGVDLAAYRVVQEALTNVLKHAGAGSTTVLVRYEPAAITLEVCDAGPVGRGPAAAEPFRVNGHGVGHGLLGMRERVTLYGGSLTAGAADRGGFRVSARIPLPRGLA